MDSYYLFSDEELVNKCKADVQPAWSELIGRYMAVSRAYASKYFVGSEYEDAVQEGMLGLLSAVAAFKAEKGVPFKSFAAVCIKNRIINFSLSKKKFSHVSFEDMEEVKAQEEVFPAAPDEIFIAENEKSLILRAVDECLTERERLVFKLYLSGLSYKEIACALDSSEKSVDGALQRAKKKLKERLSQI